MQLITSIAAFAAAATTVQAVGSAIIHNQCTFPVYMWTVDAQRNPSTPTTIGSGSTWSEGYHTPSSGGVSLKISKTTSCDKITQFEYTVASYSGQNFIWYDGSNVDCTGAECPFQPYGVGLTTSKGAACPSRNCSAGASQCDGFYTVYNDDQNSLSCDESADVILTLCTEKGSVSGGSSGGSSYGGSPSAASVASVPASSAPAAAAPVHSTTAAPSPVVAAVQTMEAPATTMVTVTKWHKHTARAEPHLHARHHQH